ncbi:MAG: hypothetical protein CM15mP77_3600 [Synechococcus sp.]|nr:MAG: hypothetical protein CM15mP77_3600 [Synechococcus sp.]
MTSAVGACWFEATASGWPLSRVLPLPVRISLRSWKTGTESDAARVTGMDRLGEHLRETQIIGSIQSTLYWDQNTRMPSAGATWRGEQLSLLATQLHARQSSTHTPTLCMGLGGVEPADRVR